MTGGFSEKWMRAARTLDEHPKGFRFEQIWVIFSIIDNLRDIDDLY